MVRIPKKQPCLTAAPTAGAATPGFGTGHREADVTSCQVTPGG